MATAAKTIATLITKDSTVRGGKACTDNTRIRVMDIALLQRQGLESGEMVDYFSVRSASPRCTVRSPTTTTTPTRSKPTSRTAAA